jgi:hypothetical protein
MGRITADQSQGVMGALGTNVAWSEIDFEELNLQDRIIRNGPEAGRQFTEFLKNGARMNAMTFPVMMRTIKVGTGLKTAEDFCTALNKVGHIDEWAINIFKRPKFTVASLEINVDLIALTRQ